MSDINNDYTFDTKNGDWITSINDGSSTISCNNNPWIQPYANPWIQPYTITTQPGIYQTGLKNTYSTMSIKPLKIETLRELREYCYSFEITKEEFEYLEESIPMNVDLLTMLNKIDIKSDYINQLNRTRKLKHILNE